MVFRTVFIIAVGFFGYEYLNPQPIGDIPFAQLTFDLIFKNLFSFALVIGCFKWFFSFPKKQDECEEDPYQFWASLGYLIVGGSVAWYLWELK